MRPGAGSLLESVIRLHGDRRRRRRRRTKTGIYPGPNQQMATTSPNTTTTTPPSLLHPTLHCSMHVLTEYSPGSYF